MLDAFHGFASHLLPLGDAGRVGGFKQVRIWCIQIEHVVAIFEEVFAIIHLVIRVDLKSLIRSMQVAIKRDRIVRKIQTYIAHPFLVSFLCHQPGQSQGRFAHANAKFIACVQSKPDIHDQIGVLFEIEIIVHCFYPPASILPVSS